MSNTATNDDTNYVAVLLEDIRDQNRAVLEAVEDLRQKVDDQPTRSEFNPSPAIPRA
jgi:hypothetical protein